MGQFTQALADYNAVIRMNPRNYFAFLNRGNLHLERNRPVAAMADYQKTIELRPDAAFGYNALAWLHATSSVPELRDTERALELARKAVSIQKEAIYLDTLAMALVMAGKVQQAHNIYLEAIGADHRLLLRYGKRLQERGLLIPAWAGTLDHTFKSALMDCINRGTHISHPTPP
ncbi:MAG: hypothetical protein MI747_00085 [Desulfobacterales bacterium]|nr:hypothetical protein [Desulfobacterales bacterium]